MEYNLKPDERASLELRGLYEKYGYRKYKMGKFEEYSLYFSNSNFLSSDKVLTFNDLDGRLLAMKPDVTLSVINNTSATDENTEKIYYIENVYRENKESHCFKEINQMGLEYLGAVDGYAVSEVMTLAAESMRMIDEDYLIVISHMDYVIELLNTMDIDENDRTGILNGIRRKNTAEIREKAKSAGVSEKDTELLCSVPFLYGSVGETVKKAKASAKNDAMAQIAEEVGRYCGILDKMGYGNNIQLDFSMVNDIDYYNGIIFHGYVRNLPGCVLAGGQYDKAMSLLGKKGKAIGFAIYLDELMKGKHVPDKYDVDAVLIYEDGELLEDIIKAVDSLQKKGLSVSAQRGSCRSIRFREKYILKKGVVVKEEK